MYPSTLTTAFVAILEKEWLKKMRTRVYNVT